MTKRNVIAIVVALLVTVGATFSVQAAASALQDDAPKAEKRQGKRGKGHFGRRGGRGFGRGFAGGFLRGVDLTDEQKAQMKEIMQAQRTTLEPLMKQMAENRKALREASQNGQFNEDMVKALATQQGQLHAQMIIERERTHARIFNLLTPEQRAKISERQEQMKQRFEQRRQQREQRRQERKSTGTAL